MTRFARQLLFASLIALHATVVLCGPCLHGLPGWGHGSVFSGGADAEDVRGPSRGTHLQPDDCPVCHFLSQAQLPVDLARVKSIGCSLEFKPVLWCHTASHSLLLSTSPRAPPTSRTVES
jgi:hypothetical protein